MLVGCCLEGPSRGQVTPAVPLRKGGAAGFGDAAFILQAGHLAVFLVILSVCGSFQHCFSSTQPDKKEARGRLWDRSETSPVSAGGDGRMQMEHIFGEQG